ncbi:MAG: putative rane protein [Herbinix sp.]|jgi:YYY domain-containing protein|nr:putative rane protein [Herbinix sp.]
MIKKILLPVIAIILAVMGKTLLKADYIPFLQWWITIFCLGIVFMPLTNTIFHTFDDRGYLFSKTIGLAVTGYFMWLLSSLHILKFNSTSCIISAFLGVLINIIVLLIQRYYGEKNCGRRSLMYAITKDGALEKFFTRELIFFGLFLLFTYIRGFKPEAYGTEKFMDYGFMTSMMRSDYMPSEDLWFSGNTINYYYVGQYMACFLAKLSFVKVTHAYNLMLMMTGAFCFALTFSLGYQIALSLSAFKGKKRSLFATISGITSGAAVTFAGNMHYPIFRFVEPAVRYFFGIEAATKAYWFPDSTRYIGYQPDTTDKTIHEFPSYSFVLGDLHAHVINILFVLTVLGILFAWLLSRETKKDQKPALLHEIFHPAILLISFFIGLFHTTNFWDFPIYYVVSGAVILFSNGIVYNFKSKALWLTAIQGCFVFAVSELICLPFTLTFDKISSDINLTVARTPLYQLIVLWGLPIFMVISFVVFRIAAFMKNVELTKVKGDNKDKAKDKKVKGSIGNIAVFRFIGSLSSSDLFILLIGLCAIGLIIMPEIIYVEDIYSGDYKRANTMFKLTYQAYIMFGISMGYLFFRLLRFGDTIRQKKYAAAGLLFFVFTLFYSVNAVNAWFGNIFHQEGNKGINAAAFMETQMPDDYLATNWLNEHVTGMPVVLEANGDSYTDYQRVSVITGLPTLLGWRTHEWLWRSDTAILDERAADIELIYTSQNEQEVKQLIAEYKVSYLYVGKLEQEKYSTVNHELLKSLGEIVFDSPATDEKTYETYIVKIGE